MFNDTSIEILLSLVDELRNRRKLRAWFFTVSSIITVAAILLFFLANIFFPPNVSTIVRDVSQYFIFIFGVITSITLLSFTSLGASRSTEFYRRKIQRAEERVEAEPEKVKPAWDLARVTLEAYFNRNLGQVNYIFWLSVGVMIVGFIIIIWGISQAIRLPSVILPAAITAIAGIITEFIGATFLFIYRSTIRQAINYTKTLERINSVGMAMQILDTMPDETKREDLKSRTKAVIVELLVKQMIETSKEDKQP